MRINIVTEPDMWILRRISESLKDRMPDSYITDCTPDCKADVNLYIYYRFFTVKTEQIDIGLFTHREKEWTAGAVFDKIAQEVDYCIAMCNKTALLLPQNKTVVIKPCPDEQFLKNKLIIGCVGRNYASGRKKFQRIDELREIEGVEIIFTDQKIKWEDMPSFYRSIDYLLVLSDNEGGPMPVLEALASNKPIIAPDVGWCWDYPVIRYNDFEELKNIIRSLIVPKNCWDISAKDTYEFIKKAYNKKLNYNGVKSGSLDNKLYESIDDRGLVYLKGHDKRTSQFYGSRWDCGVPVKIDDNGNVINPGISVVMSVYNGEKYLEQAIRSVLGQSFPNFEFIIINDASTDRSEEIIKSFDDPRIKLVRNESNRGLTSSLVKGFSLAKGKYVARMDADDISLPHRFETEVHFLDTHQDYALVGSSYYLINNTGEKQGIIPVLLANDQLKKELPEKNWFCHGSVLIRKTAYDSVGGYDTDFHCAQDYDLWLRIAEQFKIGNIEEPLYCWRDSPGCVSRAKAEEQEMFAARAKENAVLRRASKVNVNDKRPLVSIIVPTFNRPHLIGNTIQSILNQTYPNIEIVIVNDCGSPVEDIVYHLNNKNNIVYLRHSVNAGLAATRNTGIRTARGDYIGYLDDDDIYYPEHVETLVDFIIKNKVQVAYTDACRATQSLVNGIWETKERKVLYSMDFNNDIILIRNIFPVLCILHEKKCVDTVGGFDESLKTHEDWDLWLRMSRKYALHHIKKITAEYVVRRGTSEQMSTNPVSNFNETRKMIYQKYASLIKDRPDIIKAQEAELMNNDPRMSQEQMLRRLNEFIENVSILVEKGDLQGGLKLFDAHRHKFPDSIPELMQIDTIINKLRSKIKMMPL